MNMATNNNKVTEIEVPDVQYASESSSGFTLPHIPSSETQLEEYFSRPIQVARLLIDGGGVVTGFPADSIFRTWKAKSTVSPKLAGYAGFRGDLKLTFVYQGAPQTLGTAICAFFPMAGHTSNTFGSTALIPSWTGAGVVNNIRSKLYDLPHVLINYEEATSKELFLPCPTAQSFLSITGSTAYAGDWFPMVTPINDLRTSSDGSPPDIIIVVYASYHNVSLFAPCLATGKMENGSPISTALDRVSNVLGMVKTVFPIVTPWQVIAQGGAELARILGFSRPPSITQSAMVPFSSSSLSHTAGSNDFSFRLSLDPNSAMDVTHQRIPMGKENDMMLSQIYSIWSPLFLDELQNDSTKYYTIPQAVGSVTGTTVGDPIIFTNLGYFSGMFEWWTGSIEIKLEFIANSFCRGLYGIVLVPYGGADPAAFDDEEAVYCLRKTCEVIGRTECIFTVPYSYHNPVHSTQISNLPVIYGKTSFAPTDGSPYIKIFEIAPLTASTGVSLEMRINLFIRGGKDFEFVVPHISMQEFTYWASNGVVPQGKLETMAIELVGENVSSVNQLAKRSCYLGALNPTNLTTYQINFFGLVPGASTVPLLMNSTFFTYFTLVTMCFLGSRGGARYKFAYNDSSANSVIYCRLDVGQGPISALGLGTKRGLNNYDSSAGAQVTTMRGRDFSEFEIPHREMSYYREGWRLGGYNSTHTGSGEIFEIQFNTTGETVNVFQAAADDYTLYGYLGPPILKRQLTP